MPVVAPEHSRHHTHSPGSESDTGSRKKQRSHRDNTAAFRGVRRRKWGRYVSEIRLPGQKTRIWLGSFGSAEMAARAYDSAAFFLKRDPASLNFPESVASLPQPVSCSRRDIQLAAAKAAVGDQQHEPPAPNRRNGEVEECKDWWEELGSISVEQVKEGPWGSMDELGFAFIGEDDDLFVI